jgi:hypothetical protein
MMLACGPSRMQLAEMARAKKRPAQHAADKSREPQIQAQESRLAGAVRGHNLGMQNVPRH